jgi:uncharacterized damage-inducible protein DinB
MTQGILSRIFEHNNWANSEVIRACSVLAETQLNLDPESATKGSIWETLLHLVDAQLGYLSLLTGVASQYKWQSPPRMDELMQAAKRTGAELLDLAEDMQADDLTRPMQTSDGYSVEPWVVMLQVIDHASEHREQIKSMLTALGVKPPEMDGWTYGEVTHAVILSKS